MVRSVLTSQKGEESWTLSNFYPTANMFLLLLFTWDFYLELFAESFSFSDIWH